MIRYSIKEVITGFVPKIDRNEMQKFNTKTTILIPKKEQAHICVVDREAKEAIDIFEPNKKYPFLGEEEFGEIVVTEEIDENKEYAIMAGDAPFSYFDKIKIIKQLKAKGVIGQDKITICNAVIGKYITKKNTESVYNGKIIFELEFDSVGVYPCILDENGTVATNMESKESYSILKKDDDDIFVDGQELEAGKEYVVEILHKKEIQKVKKYEGLKYLNMQRNQYIK